MASKSVPFSITNQPGAVCICMGEIHPWWFYRREGLKVNRPLPTVKCAGS